MIGADKRWTMERKEDTQMNETYTRATWQKAYSELLGVLEQAGIPSEVGKVIAQNLRSERAIRRMIGYMRNARPRTMEEVADEMLAIMEDRDRWTRKKEAEESNARYNAWLNSDMRQENQGN